MLVHDVSEAQHVLVGLLGEDRRVDREQRVEPSASLVDRLDHQLGGELHRLGAPVHVRVAHLGRRHRPRVEPGIDHRCLAGGGLGARATRHHHLVDGGSVRVDVVVVVTRQLREFLT